MKRDTADTAEGGPSRRPGRPRRSDDQRRKQVAVRMNAAERAAAERLAARWSCSFNEAVIRAIIAVDRAE